MPLKFYLRIPYNNVGGNPATNSPVGSTATWTPGVTNGTAVTPLLYNRLLSEQINTAGNGGSLDYSSANNQTAQKQPLLRFVSNPLVAQTIVAQTPTLQFSYSASNTISSFQITYSLVLWRPGTGLVATLIAYGSNNTATATTTQAVASLTGVATTAATAQLGDVLILELWRNASTQTMSTTYTNSIQYGGPTEGTGGTVNASFLSFPNNIALYVPPTPTDTYGAAVMATAGIQHYWRLGEVPTATMPNLFDTVQSSAASLTLPLISTGSVQEGQQSAVADGLCVTFPTGVTTDVIEGGPVGQTDISVANNFSVELWVKPSTNTQSALTYYMAMCQTSSPLYGWALQQDQATPGRIGLTFGGGGAPYGPIWFAATPGVWHQVVITVTTGNVWSLYVDAVLVPGAITQTIGSGGTQDLQIGHLPYTANSSIQGSIDEVSFYGTVLSLATIQDHYTKGQGLGGTIATQASSSVSAVTLTARPSVPAITDAYGQLIQGTSGLLHYWRMDETQNAMLDYVGTADAGVVGTNLNRGVATRQGFGGTGVAYLSSAQGTGIRAQAADMLNGSVPAWTYETWIFIPSSGMNNSYPINATGSGVTGWSLYFQTSTGPLVGAFGSGSYTYLTPAPAISRGNWHHVVLTYDGTNAQIWCDGVSVAGPTAAPITYPNASTAAVDFGCVWYQGATYPTNTAPWTIDECAFYSGVLSSATILQHYQLGSGGVSGATVAQASSSATPTILTMPPQIVQPITVSDPFNANTLNATLWGFWGTGASIYSMVGQRSTWYGPYMPRVLPNGTAGTYGGVLSKASYNAVGRDLFLYLVQINGSSVAGMVGTAQLQIDSNNYVEIGLVDTNLVARYCVAGTLTTLSSTPSPAQNFWVRLTESQGVTYWSYSTGGLNGTWTQIGATLNPIAMSAVLVNLVGGCYTTVASPPSISFSSLNWWLPNADVKTSGSSSLAAPTIYKNLTGLSNGTCTVAPDTYGRVIRADSPVCWWHLDEQLGVQKGGDVTTTDAGPNNRWAYYNKPAGGAWETQWTFGITGALAEQDSAVRFNGQYINCPYQPEFSGTGAFTFECWVRSSAWQSISWLWIMGNSQAVDRYVTCSVQNGVPVLSFYNDDYAPAGSAMSLNVWHHLAFVWEGPSTKMQRIYVDGVQLGSGRVSTGSPNVTNTQGYIGAPITGNQFLVADLDELAWYGTALSAARITAHFNAGAYTPVQLRMRKQVRAQFGVNNLAPARGRAGVSGIPWTTIVTQDSPLLWWRLGETSGTVANDSSGNGRTGTLVGAAAWSSTPVLPFESNGSVSLPGASNAYIQGPYLSCFAGGAPWTFECWIDVGSAILMPGSDYPFLSCGDASAKDQWLRCVTNGTVPELRFYSDDTTGGTPVVHPGPHHFVFVYEGTGTKTTRIYVDGAAWDAHVVTADLNVLTGSQTGNGFRIGAGDSGANTFNARIDEVTIYPTALSPARVLTHFNAGWEPPTAQPGPVTVARPLTGSIVAQAVVTGPTQLALAAQFASQASTTAVLTAILPTAAVVAQASSTGLARVPYRSTRVTGMLGTPFSKLGRVSLGSPLAMPQGLNGLTIAQASSSVTLTVRLPLPTGSFSAQGTATAQLTLGLAGSSVATATSTLPAPLLTLGPQPITAQATTTVTPPRVLVPGASAGQATSTAVLALSIGSSVLAQASSTAGPALDLGAIQFAGQASSIGQLIVSNLVGTSFCYGTTTANLSLRLAPIQVATQASTSASAFIYTPLVPSGGGVAQATSSVGLQVAFPGAIASNAIVTLTPLRLGLAGSSVTQATSSVSGITYNLVAQPIAQAVSTVALSVFFAASPVAQASTTATVVSQETGQTGGQGTTTATLTSLLTGAAGGQATASLTTLSLRLSGSSTSSVQLTAAMQYALAPIAVVSQAAVSSVLNLLQTGATGGQATSVLSPLIQVGFSATTVAQGTTSLTLRLGLGSNVVKAQATSAGFAQAGWFFIGHVIGHATVSLPSVSVGFSGAPVGQGATRGFPTFRIVGASVSQASTTASQLILYRYFAGVIAAQASSASILTIGLSDEVDTSCTVQAALTTGLSGAVAPQPKVTARLGVSLAPVAIQTQATSTAQLVVLQHATPRGQATTTGVLATVFTGQTGGQGLPSVRPYQGFFLGFSPITIAQASVVSSGLTSAFHYRGTVVAQATTTATVKIAGGATILTRSGTTATLSLAMKAAPVGAATVRAYLGIALQGATGGQGTSTGVSGRANRLTGSSVAQAASVSTLDMLLSSLTLRGYGYPSGPLTVMAPVQFVGAIKTQVFLVAYTQLSLPSYTRAQAGSTAKLTLKLVPDPIATQASSAGLLHAIWYLTPPSIVTKATLEGVLEPILSAGVLAQASSVAGLSLVLVPGEILTGSSTTAVLQQYVLFTLAILAQAESDGLLSVQRYYGSIGEPGYVVTPPSVQGGPAGRSRTTVATAPSSLSFGNPVGQQFQNPENT